MNASRTSRQIVSVSPVTLPAPGRGADLPVRVTAPATGEDLPVIVLSHGYGWSGEGYRPLADFWAAHGFVVLQPTHLDSCSLAVPPQDPRTPLIWRFRVEDLRRTLDELETLENALPGLAGRVDREKIAVAGHSWGAQSASMLLGAGIDDGSGEDFSDGRVRAGVLFAVPGRGGEDLSPFAAEHFSFMNPDFRRMSTPALVVAGDDDHSALTVRGPDWFTDAYHLSPAGKSLLTLFGAQHTLGGIAGYAVTETTDENPARVAVIQELSTAYLRDALGPEDGGWPAAREALAAGTDPLGRIESS